MRWWMMMLLLGCRAGTKDSSADLTLNVDETRCAAEFTIWTPDGNSTTLDYCAASSMDATFEFDPDEPPQVRDPTIVFKAEAGGDFDCSVTITEPAICGEGYYRMDGSSGGVRFTTYDCRGVGNDFEGVFNASKGYLRIDAFHAGETVGDLSGTPLTTQMAGHIDIESASGIVLTGEFSLAQEITANDAEEANCVVSDGDADNDGHIDTYFGGNDPDDTDPDVPGDAEDPGEPELPNLKLIHFDYYAVENSTEYWVDVKNTGGGDASSFKVDLFHDYEAADFETHGTQSRIVSALAAGTTAHLTFVVGNNCDGCRTWVFVDSFRAITESDESDNSGSIAVD